MFHSARGQWFAAAAVMKPRAGGQFQLFPEKDKGCLLRQGVYKERV